MRLKKTVWKSRTTTQLYPKLTLVMYKYTSTSDLNDILHDYLTCVALAYFCEVNIHFRIWIPPQPAQIATPTLLNLAHVQSSKRWFQVLKPFGSGSKFGKYKQIFQSESDHSSSFFKNIQPLIFKSSLNRSKHRFFWIKMNLQSRLSKAM